MFNVNIEQSVLMKALEYLEPTVGKNAAGLGDNCLCMSTTGNGTMTMYTTNTLEFTKLEAIVATGGNTVENAPLVDFKRFKGIIATIPSNEFVTLEANVNDLLINFALKKTPLKLIGCNNGIIPLPNQTFPSDAMVIPKQFIKNVVDNACSIIIDSNSAPIFNCIRISTDGINVEATALDMTGKRTFAQIGITTSNNPAKYVLMEASKLKKSMKIFEDFNELEFYMDNALVRVDGTDMVSSYSQKTKGMITGISYFLRRVHGTYPSNIRSSFIPGPKEFVEINKEEVLNCFSRVKAIEDSTSIGIVGFEVNGSSINVTMNSAYGNIEDNLTAENSVVNSIATTFKYQHFSDIIKTIGTDTFEIGVLPNHPTNYVIRTKGDNNVLFTLPGMQTAQSNTP